jgi:hypothetical protein
VSTQRIRVATAAQPAVAIGTSTAATAGNNYKVQRIV